MKYEIIRTDDRYVDTTFRRFLGENESISAKDVVMVHRIRATKTFVNSASGKRVKKGELGGWVQHEANLSQYGTCWVDEKSFVVGGARVSGHAFVSDSKVSGKARVSGEALLSDCSSVERSATVCDTAHLSGTRVTENAVVGDCAHLAGGLVAGNAVVGGDTRSVESAPLYVFSRGGNEYCPTCVLVKLPKVDNDMPTPLPDGFCAFPEPTVVTGGLVSSPFDLISTQKRGVVYTLNIKNGLAVRFDTSNVDDYTPEAERLSDSSCWSLPLSNELFGRNSKSLKYVIHPELSYVCPEAKHGFAYAVRALVDIPSLSVKQGHLYGKVDSYTCLSQSGNSFVFGTVVAGATVREDAVVKDGSLVTGKSVISGQAVVNQAEVKDSVVRGKSVLNKGVKVSDNSLIDGDVDVYSDTLKRVSVKGEGSLSDSYENVQLSVWGSTQQVNTNRRLTTPTEKMQALLQVQSAAYEMSSKGMVTATFNDEDNTGYNEKDYCAVIMVESTLDSVTHEMKGFTRTTKLSRRFESEDACYVTQSEDSITISSKPSGAGKSLTVSLGC